MDLSFLTLELPTTVARGSVVMTMAQVLRPSGGDPKRTCRKSTRNFTTYTLPETNSSHLPRSHPQQENTSSNHPFAGVNSLLVSVENRCPACFQTTFRITSSCRFPTMGRIMVSWWKPNFVSPPAFATPGWRPLRRFLGLRPGRRPPSQSPAWYEA